MRGSVPLTTNALRFTTNGKKVRVDEISGRKNSGRIQQRSENSIWALARAEEIRGTSKGKT
jgi:hypothetical protein